MAEANFDKARFNMVEQQIRTWDVLDTSVLDLLLETPREEFVPQAYKNLAYSDITIPIGHGQDMMFPKIQAHLLQALRLKGTENVLEIGTGTGFVTALLAKAAKHVYSVDIYPDFIRTAAQNLRKLGLDNVTLEEGDASNGWKDHAPYHAIAVTGAVHSVPEAMKQQLTVGGRMFVIVGESPAMEALVVVRTGENSWTTESLFETDLAYLKNAAKPSKFEF